VLILIFLNCECEDICHFQSVCKNWKEIGRNEDLWKVMFRRDFINQKIEDGEGLQGYKKLFDLFNHQYVRAIRDTVAKPTEEQIEAFVDYVSTAHSWYKHLPVIGGQKFIFFLDPTANMRKVDGKYIKVVEGDGTKFHYNWRTTDTYHTEFGLLSYIEKWNEDKTQILIETVDPIRSLPIPEKIEEQGLVLLTAMFHGRSESYRLLDSTYERFVLCQKKCEIIEGSVFNEEFSPQPVNRRDKSDGIGQLLPEIMDFFKMMYDYEVSIAKSKNESDSRLAIKEKLLSQLFPHSDLSTLTNKISTKLDSNTIKDHAYVIVLAERERERYMIKEAIRNLLKNYL